MSTVAEMVVKVGADISNYEKNMSQVQKSMQTVGEKMQSVGQTIGTAFSAAGLAVGAGLGLAVNKSMEFESQLSRVGAIAGASSTELDALRKSALDLGASTSKSASEVAQGQEALAALGFTANDIIGAMPGVISAAEASGADMAQTAEVMASALNIFGLEASDANRVADILAQTANQSAADINDMSYALKYAGPVAASLGVPIEELSGAIGLMTNAGLDGSSAGTALRAGLLSLLSPSEKNAKAMEAMGLSMTDANGKFVGISGVISQLNESMAGMTEAQKTATLASLVGTEASSGFLALMKAGPEEVDKMTASLQNSGGASAEAAAKMKDNLKGAVDELSGAFETMQITLGTALTPAIETAAGVLQKLADWFNQLSPSTQSFIAIAGAVSAVLMVLVGVVGFLTMAMGALAAAEWAAIAPVAGIVAAITGAIIVIVALVAAVVQAYQKIDWFRAMVDTAWAAIKSAFNTALTFIRGVVQSIMGQVTAFFSQKLSEIKKFWDQNGTQIKQSIQLVMLVIQTIIRTAMAVIQSVMTIAWNVIKSVTSAVWGIIKGVISGGINIILGIIKTFSSLLTGNWKGAWEGVKQIMSGAIKILETMAKSMIDIGKSIITGLIKGISNAAVGLYNKAKEIANSVKNKFKSIFDINSPSKEMEWQGQMLGKGLSGGLMDSVRGIMSAAGKVAQAAMPNMAANAPALPAVAPGPTITVHLAYNGNGTQEDADRFGDMVEDVLTTRLGMESLFGGVR